jgi:hypothetical protein
MGPFTWVMACVVWSASQSTVPVVHSKQGCVRGRHNRQQ